MMHGRFIPQIMVVGLGLDLTWIGRGMDASAAAFTTYLPACQIIPFPENYVQKKEVHPAQFMAEWMILRGLN